MRNTKLQGPVDRCNAPFFLLGCCSVESRHAHTAQALSRYVQALAAELTYWNCGKDHCCRMLLHAGLGKPEEKENCRTFEDSSSNATPISKQKRPLPTYDEWRRREIGSSSSTD
jgi:hypothetical protein